MTTLSYGAMEDVPTSSRSLLVGTNNKPSSSSLRYQQRGSQRPVLKTIISRRRVMTHSINRKSFVYTMLNPRSIAWQAVAFKWFITLVIVADLSAFIASTEPDLSQQHTDIYRVWEAIDSWIFLIEYILRLITVTESIKYGTMGPVTGRLRYMMTTPALIDLAATLPYFLEQCFSGLNLPTLTYLRAFRLLRILKTQGFNEAMKSVYRVFRFNSEILWVAIWIGLGLVLSTGVMMYYLRPRDVDNAQFRSLPATIFLSAMMLTGQGGPDGELPWYTAAVVLLTGVFSIGMFAIPASMLTWGFEGEAERLAKLRWKKANSQNDNGTQRTENDRNDDWSYSSCDYSTDEEYLNTIAGFEDDDEEEEEAKKVFQLADLDGSGNISLGEFLKLSREIEANRERSDENMREPSPLLANRLQELEEKVKENSMKLDRICNILEGRKF